MRIRPVRKIILFVFYSLWLAPSLVFAQQASCPEIVQTALAQTDQSCEGTSRNQACYGNISLEAQPQEGVPEFNFTEPGDIVEVAGIQTLTLNELDEADNTWGIAMMRIQANIPDTLPGQNLTFLLFGNVVVDNAVTSNAEPVTFEVTASGNINVRSAPSTDDPVVENLADGDTVTANGRNPEGDWLRVALSDGQPGWVFAELVTTEDDSTILDVVDPLLPGPLNPMQAFYFQSGIGDAPCAEAPDSGILIQTPEGAAEVSFVVNEVNVQLSSTAYFQAQPSGNMTIQTIEGLARVSAFGVTQTGLAGTIISVPLDSSGAASGPPNAPQSYDDTVLQALPIQLLERVIEIAPPLPEDKLVLGAGDIQYTLSWNNGADMDLHVIEPDGEYISFFSPVSSIGGQLDVDSNYPCGDNSGSVENVFWPEGEAPSGIYQVMVDEFSTCGGGAANWTLTVLVDGVPIHTERGTGDGPVFEFDFSSETLQLEFSGEGTEADFAAFSGGSSGTLDPSAAEDAQPVTFGETLSDTIESNTADYWTFQGTAGQGIIIVMRAASGSGIDTYLTLYGTEGEFIESNDDFDGLNSQIGPYPLPTTGTYSIEARSFSGDGGDYELTVSEAEVEPPFEGQIAVGETGEHTLQPNAQDRWKFDGEAGQTIIINMNGEFDTYLELYGTDGQLIAENDDFDGLNSQIGPMELPDTGSYTIVARSFSSGGGDYELRIREG